jgi:hypothetical protein
MVLTFVRNTYARGHHNFWNFLFLTLPLIGISLVGCNNTCFSFTSNPPTGTINIKVSDPTPTCMFTKANGAVRVVAHTFMCVFCSPSSQVQHIFLTLQGVEVHPNSMADDASPDWEELLPQLSGQPLQIDLMNGQDGVSARQSLGEHISIPAGTYRQLRLRFVPNQPASDQAPLESNACGAAGFHCVASEDGRIQPLQVDGPAPELRITSDRIAGGSLLILPDSNSDLVLEFNVAWSLFSSDHRSVRLLPALIASASLKR